MNCRKLSGVILALGLLLAMVAEAMAAPGAPKDKKKSSVDPNDPTYRLYQLLDTTHGGKLDDFFVLADVYKDPKTPGKEDQHVLRIEYDGKRLFGRFRIYVRSVGRMTPEQLATYTAQQIYDFANADEEKFEKIEPGPFGQTGDLYLRTEDDRPLHSAPTTDAVRKTYETFVAQYILPALEKK